MHFRILILFFLLIIMMLVSFFGIQLYKNQRCEHTDKRLCSFIRQFKNEKFNILSGVYILSYGKEKKSRFSFNNDDGTLTIISEKKPVIDIVETKKYVYLYDPQKKTWYKQQKIYASNYSYELPSTTKQYMFGLQKWILDSIKDFKYVQKTTCDSEICYEYSANQKDTTNSAYLYINGQNKLVLIKIRWTNYSQDISFHFDKPEIKEPSQFQEKGNENVFLMIIKDFNNVPAPTYKYVQEFELERNQSE